MSPSSVVLRTSRAGFLFSGVDVGHTEPCHRPCEHTLPYPPAPLCPDAPKSTRFPVCVSCNGLIYAPQGQVFGFQRFCAINGSWHVGLNWASWASPGVGRAGLRHATSPSKMSLLVLVWPLVAIRRAEEGITREFTEEGSTGEGFAEEGVQVRFGRGQNKFEATAVKP